MRKGFLILVIALGLMLFGGTLVSAGDKPTLDIDWYGYFKLDGSYDQNLTSHGNFVMWVPQPAYDKDDDQFNMTANQTRLGFKANGNGYGDAAVKGQLELDLYGASAAENKAALVLRARLRVIHLTSPRLRCLQLWIIVVRRWVISCRRLIPLYLLNMVSRPKGFWGTLTNLSPGGLILWRIISAIIRSPLWIDITEAVVLSPLAS